MSTHIRTWGIALIAIGFFAIPTLAIQAEADPLPPAIISHNTAVAANPAIAMANTVEETLHLRVTAYSSDVNQTDSTPFITANGGTVHDGIVATNLLPFGTKVMIPSLFGDKVFTVTDRMNKKFSNSIDIWMSTRNAALDFGVHTADIIVLASGADANLSLK